MSTHTVQEIFQKHWAGAFPSMGRLPRHTLRVVNSLKMCRTEMLGAHRYTCDSPGCRAQITVNNSCRDRHCPQCQAAARAQWLTERLGELLPVQYFHVVFTVPYQLRPIMKRNPRVCYALFFKAASETILTLCADPERLNGQAGLILMLHTWTQRLTYHPHLHGIIPGGVLSAKNEQWHGASGKFLLPVKVVSRMFRGKFLALLKQAFAEDTITDPSGSWPELIRAAYAKNWHVFLESSFRSPVRVVKYLAAYTNRVAITNKRILDVSANTVRHSYIDRRNNLNIPRTQTLKTSEFIERFVDHILPKGFVKIRYYGILSCRTRRELLPRCYDSIEQNLPQLVQGLRGAVAQEILNNLTRSTDRVCEVCGCGHLHITQWMPPLAVQNVGGND